MTEYQEVGKMDDRLCKSYDECYGCPLFRVGDNGDPIVCRYWALTVDPETVEKVILHRDKEHSIKED